MEVVTQQYLQLSFDFLQSSDSSDSEDEFIEQYLATPEMIPKVQNYSEVVETYNNEQFRKHFRINWSTFYELEQKFLQSDLSKKRWTGGSAMIPPRTQLLIFIWFASNKCVIRDISDRFNVSLSTVHKILVNVATFLLEIAPDIIKFPNSLHKKVRIADQFMEISGFPNVLGCIDGTYIPIRTPAYKIKSTYVNRHDIPALTLQGICDANKKFLDVFTGVSGKIHDARIYRLSFISDDIYNICCGELFHLLGDSAYPLSVNLLTPFRDYGNLTREQQNYNRKFAQTRVKIENAFGLLKQRFRQLTRLDCKTVCFASKFITACCVLHNICLELNDIWENEVLEVEEEEEAVVEGDANANYIGEQKRQNICRLLAERLEEQ